MNEEQKKASGHRLSYAMKLAGMSQAELLKKAQLEGLDISYQQMSPYCKGKRGLKYEHALVFSKILGVDPGYLLGADGFNPSMNDPYVYASVTETKRDIDFLSVDIRHDNENILSEYANITITGLSRSFGEVTHYHIRDDRSGNKYKIPIDKYNAYISDIENYISEQTAKLLDSEKGDIENED